MRTEREQVQRHPLRHSRAGIVKKKEKMLFSKAKEKWMTNTDKFKKEVAVFFFFQFIGNVRRNSPIKEYNLKCHYENYKGNGRKKGAKQLQRGQPSQQAAVEASYVISELIAKFTEVSEGLY